MSLFGFLGGHSDDKGCDWYCDECDTYMNNQPCFTTSSGEWTCTECGAINDVSENNILYDDDEDDDDNDYCNNAMDEINETPVGCRACGGPYPNCKDSCPMFDD